MPRTVGQAISTVGGLVIGQAAVNAGIMSPITVIVVSVTAIASLERIRELAMGTIAKAKEYDSDFLGLMQKLHRYKPSYWQEIAPNWRESFHEADIEVEVKAKVVGAGMMTSKALQVKP